MSWADHVHPHSPLTEVVPGLWQVTGTLPGSQLSRNMALWRLSAGGLCIHSAVACDAPTMAAIEALGEPRVLIIPCRMHRADAAAWKARYPGITVVAPRAAREAAAEVVAVDADAETVLPECGTEALAPAGLKPFELVYKVPLPDGRHALVATDSLFNHDHLPGPTGWVLRYITASTGHFGITRLGRWLLLKDRAAFAGWLRSLAAAPDLAAVLVGHGHAVVQDPGARLAEAADRV